MHALRASITLATVFYQFDKSHFRRNRVNFFVLYNPIKFFSRSKQEDKLNEAVTKFTEDQKKSVAETERTSLLQRQELIREREKKIWDTEEAHLQEKHQTARSQLKDQFLLQVCLIL